MVYLNENNSKMVIGRTKIGQINKISIYNPTDKKVYELELGEITYSSKLYTIEILTDISQIPCGQYNYKVIGLDDVELSTGICQIGDFDNKETTSYEMDEVNYKQYNYGE